MFPVSFPSDYAKQLGETIGLFSTLGMAEEHNGLNNGRLDESAYLQHCELVLGERERMMLMNSSALAKACFSWSTTRLTGCSTCCGVSATRSILDLNRTSRPSFLHVSKSIIRSAMRCWVRYSTKWMKIRLLIVLSDHGFGSFRRAFDTNTWLWQNGLLQLKTGKKPSEDSGEGFGAVEWSKT